MTTRGQDAELAARNDPSPIILSVAFPFATVGPAAVGGAEVVLSQIEAALPARGFRSVVVAREGSQPAGQLYATAVPDREIDDELRAQVEAAHQANLDRALAEHPVSLVHLHGLDFHRYRLPVGMPVVVTLHLPPGWYPETIWESPANYQLLCVSATQRAACPAHARGRVQVIGNGVPLPNRSTMRPEGRYALMLSRICPEKNVHMGLDAARQADLPAVLAGEVFFYAEHRRYFTTQVEPRLSVPGAAHMTRDMKRTVAEARFLGPVTGAPKARLLSRAACLLQPSLAPETSSLVAMEALAAGVPVIAVASGALPEIVEHGRTGLLVPPEGDIVANLAAALRQVPSLDRLHCRQAAEQRFSLGMMLEAYAALYRTMGLPLSAFAPAAGERLPSQAGQKGQLAQSSASGSATPSPAVFSTEELTTTLHSGFYALESLLHAWTEFWEQDPSATPFQHPAWLLPWARQFGPDGTLHTVTVQDRNDQLLGLLPCFAYADPISGVRKLLLLGSGTADYLGGTFHSAAPFLAGLALRAAVSAIENVDQLDFMQLRSDSPLLLAAEGGALSPCERRPGEPCAVLPVAMPLPARVAANIRRYRRRAELHSFLLCRVAATADEAADSFATLVKLHGARWESRGEDGVLGEERVRQHHRESLPALLAAGLLHLFRFQCGEQTLAVLYALGDPPGRRERRLYLYLIGIDVDHADWSPGTLILHAVWEYARREGFTTIDLLRGGETYKKLWGAAPQPTFALHLGAIRSAGHLGATE